MKKTMILLIELLTLCIFTACSAQSALDSESNGADRKETATSATETIATTTTTTSDTNLPSKKAGGTTATQTGSAAVTGCVHDYIVKVVAPTCIEQGYTLHTCKKCKKSYRDSYVAPRHQYGKYLCEICGRPDPANPIHSLCAWLDKNGTLNGKGNLSFIDYIESGITYSIIGDPYDLSSIYLEFEKGDELFRIWF